MQFRIGLNLEDVIKDEDRIYGDGVNIATRLGAKKERTKGKDRVRGD
jgi:adenylate cyclase